MAKVDSGDAVSPMVENGRRFLEEGRKERSSDTDVSVNRLEQRSEVKARQAPIESRK